MIVSIIATVDLDTTIIAPILSQYDDIQFEFISSFVKDRLSSKNTKTIRANGKLSTSDNFSDYAVANGDYVIIIREFFVLTDLPRILSLIGKYDVFETGKTTYLSKTLLKRFFRNNDIPLRTSITLLSRRAVSIAERGGSMRHSVLAQLYKTNYLLGTEVRPDWTIISRGELAKLFTLLLFHTDFFPKLVKYFAFLSFTFVLFFGGFIFYRYLQGYTVQGWSSTVLTLLIIQSSLSFYVLILFKYLKHLFADRNRAVSVIDYSIL